MGVRCPGSGAADPGFVIKISFLRIKRLPFTAVTPRLLIRVGAGFAQARWSFTGSPSTVSAQPLRAPGERGGRATSSLAAPWAQVAQLIFIFSGPPLCLL